jgi:hypothetical protein
LSAGEGHGTRSQGGFFVLNLDKRDEVCNDGLSEKSFEKWMLFKEEPQANPIMGIQLRRPDRLVLIFHPVE